MCRITGSTFGLSNTLFSLQIIMGANIEIFVFEDLKTYKLGFTKKLIVLEDSEEAEKVITLYNKKLQ
jgi:hypothetical protein